MRCYAWIKKKNNQKRDRRCKKISPFKYCSAHHPKYVAYKIIPCCFCEGDCRYETQACKRCIGKIH